MVCTWFGSMGFRVGRDGVVIRVGFLGIYLSFEGGGGMVEGGENVIGKRSMFFMG